MKRPRRVARRRSPTTAQARLNLIVDELERLATGKMNEAGKESEEGKS